MKIDPTLFDWKQLHNKTLTVWVGAERYDGKEETVVVMGYDAETGITYVLHSETKELKR